MHTDIGLHIYTESYIHLRTQRKKSEQKRTGRRARER